MTARQLDGRLDSLLTTMADGFSTSPRSPVLRSPAEYGLAYEDVEFPAEDGTPLRGWFVPSPGADSVVIVNHPRWFSRSGLPAQFEPWRSITAATGNDIEVDLVPDIAALHAAGHHVLAYDLRNFGRSGTADGGLTSGGIRESRDVVGSLDYVRSRSDLRDATIALFSRCLGANATLFAMRRRPAEFDRVRCLVACQPLSPRMVLEQGLRRAGVDVRHLAELDRRIAARTGYRLDDMSPVDAARAVRVPTLVYQVRDDVMTRPSDVQAIFDAMPVRAKELFWIRGTTRRFDGYRYFQREPGRILDWLARRFAVGFEPKATGE